MKSLLHRINRYPCIGQVWRGRWDGLLYKIVEVNQGFIKFTCEKYEGSRYECHIDNFECEWSLCN